MPTLQREKKRFRPSSTWKLEDRVLMSFDPSPYANVSSFAAVATGQLSNGQLGVWAVDDHGGLHGRWTKNPSPISGWENWTPMGAPSVPLSKVAVVQLADHRLEMYAIDVNGGLWSQTQSGTTASSHWDDWTRVSTPAPFRDGAVSTMPANGQVALWGVTDDGSVRYSWKTTTDPRALWSGSWYDESIRGEKAADIVAVPDGDSLRVFAVNTSGKKVYEYHPDSNGGGHGWTTANAMNANAEDYSLRSLTATILPNNPDPETNNGAVGVWGTAQKDLDETQIRPTRIASSTLPVSHYSRWIYKILGHFDGPKLSVPNPFDVTYDDLTNLSEVSAVQYVDGRQIALFATTTDGRIFQSWTDNNNSLAEWKGWADFGADFKARNAIPQPTNRLPPIVDPPVVQPPVATQPPAVQPPPVATQRPAVQPPVATQPPAVQQPPVATQPPVVAQPPVVQSPPSPSVAGATLKKNRRRRVVEVQIYFNMAMDSTSASSSINYQLYAVMGRGRRAKQVYVPIAYASYDPSQRLTTLTLARPQSAKSFQLALTSWNLKGVQGGALNPAYQTTIY